MNEYHNTGNQESRELSQSRGEEFLVIGGAHWLLTRFYKGDSYTGWKLNPLNSEIQGWAEPGQVQKNQI